MSTSGTFPASNYDSGDPESVSSNSMRTVENTPTLEERFNTATGTRKRIRKRFQYNDTTVMYKIDGNEISVSTHGPTGGTGVGPRYLRELKNGDQFDVAVYRQIEHHLRNEPKDSDVDSFIYSKRGENGTQTPIKVTVVTSQDYSGTTRYAISQTETDEDGSERSTKFSDLTEDQIGNHKGLCNRSFQEGFRTFLNEKAKGKSTANPTTSSVA
ncbi:uncharacterized protein IL334_003203 [Kwoniella shivajii]|uniref:Uncharacterized protein n=1 Tax=Kwoniella shivajii TaxID=564305 RepID=A0ABZ1CWW4_9TREE|nr:hypothetical protein IL334_003203 [Kwoniella shivajii]